MCVCVCVCVFVKLLEMCGVLLKLLNESNYSNEVYESGEALS